MKKRKSFMEHYNEVKNSPKTKQYNYEKKVRAVLIFILMPIFLFVGYLTETLLGIPSYMAATAGGVLAIVVAVLWAENKANKKFNGSVAKFN